MELEGCRLLKVGVDNGGPLRDGTGLNKVAPKPEGFGSVLGAEAIAEAVCPLDSGTVLIA